MTSIRIGIPVNARYVTLKVSVWCKSFSIRQLCFVISSQTAPLSLKTQRAFSIRGIHNHAALAISIWPLKKCYRLKLFQNYWQPCWIVLPDAILEGNKGNKKRWPADILSQEAKCCFFIHLSKRALFPSSDCIRSYKKLTYSTREISEPCCSSDKRFVCAYTLEARTMILVHKPGLQFLSSGNLLVSVIPNYTHKDTKINAQKRVTISIKTKHISYRNP